MCGTVQWRLGKSFQWKEAHKGQIEFEKEKPWTLAQVNGEADLEVSG